MEFHCCWTWKRTNGTFQLCHILLGHRDVRPLKPILVLTPMGQEDAGCFDCGERAYPYNDCGSSFWAPEDHKIPLVVVQIIDTTYCKEDMHLMHLIRILVLLAAHFDFWFRVKHIMYGTNVLWWKTLINLTNQSYIVKNFPVNILQLNKRI